jgi:hypothetical protein
MKEFFVNFFLSNGKEIEHMMKGHSLEEVKTRLWNEFVSNDSPLLDLDDMVIVKAHVQYFTIREFDIDNYNYYGS